jgi:hypothetical protein
MSDIFTIFAFAYEEVALCYPSIVINKVESLVGGFRGSHVGGCSFCDVYVCTQGCEG